MHKNLLTLIAAIVLCISITAVATAEDELNTGFGFAVGSVCGNGFSIKRLPVHGFGYQAGIIYFKNTDASYFNIGSELLLTLNRTSTTALYLIAGISYEDQFNTEIDSSGLNSNNREVDYESHHREYGIAGGVGMGISYNYARWERLWWSGDLVLRAYKDTVLPMPQFGVHYLFK